MACGCKDKDGKYHGDYKLTYRTKKPPQDALVEPFSY